MHTSTEQPMNQLHRERLTLESIRLREEAGLKYGDSTVLTFDFPRGGLKGLKVPEIEEVRRIADLPIDDPDRIRFDQRLRDKLLECQRSFAELGENKGAILTAPVSGDLTVAINMGYGNSEAYYMVLFDNRAYVVNSTGSTQGKCLAVDAIQFEFNKEIEQEHLSKLPPLAKLIALQDFNGQALREALPDFAAAVNTHMTQFVEALSRISSVKGLHSHLRLDVPAGRGDGSTVEVRFFLDKEMRLEKMVIAG